MSQLDLTLAVAAGVVLLLGVASRLLKRSPFQESLVAVLVGLAVGPFALGLIDVAAWGEEPRVLEQAARFTLAIGLMGVALRLDKAGLRRLGRPIGWLLTAGMLGMWLASSALAAWLLGLSVWTALLVGAVITPTDPVVASSIVTGDFAKSHLPERVRDTVSAESGANDGLAYLFVTLPIVVLSADVADPLRRFVVERLLVGVGLAVIVGVGVGWLAASLLARAKRHGLIESHSLLTYTVALSLLTLGLAALARADALISVFLAGLVFNLRSDITQQHQEENIQEAVNKLFTLPMFVILGAALPLDAWAAIGWPLLAFVVAVLALRRPLVLAALAPVLKRPLVPRDVAFLGWFGPIGVAAIYYAAYCWHHLDDPTAWHAASAAIFASIIAHGATTSGLTRAYARREERSPGAGGRG
ncbi:cation:proton antiporter [Salinarimonas rosea]|uniref:cation:proton antiporter n=1 Tax=Salinarimonas rosea TaxID=552063 RepID=UPI0004902C9D|nr:cation:proton antiporter [Salinarimonas rosea]